MKFLKKIMHILAKTIFVQGLIIWGYAARVGLFFANRFNGVSPQARLLVVALKGFRAWTRLLPNDIARVRRSQDALGKRTKTARFVRFAPESLPRCSAEWAIPRNEEEGKVVLYFHGGGFTTGSLWTHRSLVSHIAKSARVRVLNVAYRLAPEHPFPAAFEDARSAYDRLLKLGYEPKHIALAGDSAGGGLATSLLVALRDETARSGTSFAGLPAGAALLSPWVDLSDAEGSWERLATADWLLTPESLKEDACQYLGRSCDDLEQFHAPLVSPRFASLNGLPPLMIHVGGGELLRDDIKAFAKKARASGVKVYLEEWPGMVHDWHLAVAYLPEGRRAVDEIGVFLKITLA